MRRTSGFSLIEILVVLALVGLLMGLVATGVFRFSETGRITDAQARIAALSLLVESYHDREGAYPPSRLAAAGVTDGNRINEGCEALAAALRAKSYGGRPPNDAWLVNTDDDRSPMLRAADNSNALLELCDPWDNPFVYIVHGDYEREFTYRVSDGDWVEDQGAMARTSPLTGAFHNFESFQLVSAGPDGVLGTDDDLANFPLPAAGEEGN